MAKLKLKQDKGTDWGSPQPIRDTLKPVSQLAPEMIPDSLRPWLIDISHRMNCPLDFVAATAIVMISSLIGTRLTIKPKENDDWTVVPNLWGGVIGDPSAKKTPAMNEVLKLLNSFADKYNEEYREQLHQNQAAKVKVEVQKKVFQKQEEERLKGKEITHPVEFPIDPVRPTEKRFKTNDPTIEKLGELLNENEAGILVFRDELMGLLAGWERSGREQERAFYLEAWNGNSSHTVDRIGRGTLHVKDLCLSLFGGIQPSKLKGYLLAANGFENDGFVQRLQVMVYPDSAPFKYIDNKPDKDARETAFNIIKLIVESEFKEIGIDPDAYDRIRYAHFDHEAQVVFKEWLINWETNVLPAYTGLLQEHHAKYRSLMPSLALIFHVIDYAGGKTTECLKGKHLISKQATLMATNWCDYLSSHADRIYGLLETMHLTAAKELSIHLKNGDLKDGFSSRDVQRKCWKYLKDERIQPAINELVELGWLKEIEQEQKDFGRPAANTFLINPKIFN